MMSRNLFLVGLTVVAIMFIFLFIILIVYVILKKKYKLFVITTVIIIFLIGVIWGYQKIFPTQFPYVDSWICEQNKETIVAQYGTPDITFEKKIGYYLGEDDGWIMPSHLPMYYWIEFDEEDHAELIYVAASPGG